MKKKTTIEVTIIRWLHKINHWINPNTRSTLTIIARQRVLQDSQLHLLCQLSEAI